MLQGARESKPQHLFAAPGDMAAAAAPKGMTLFHTGF